MQHLFAALDPYVTNTAFLAFDAGVIAPFTHMMLRNVFGVDFTKPVANYAFNGVISAIAFVPLLVQFGAHGIPGADEFWMGLATTGYVSNTLYRLLVKRMQDGASEAVEIPATPKA